MVNIPERRRNEDEISRLRMQNAMQMRPPIQHYQKKLASPFVLGLCYVLSLFGLGVLVGPLLYLTKPLSRHHAAFMMILSLIILLSAFLWAFNYIKQADGDLPLWVPDWLLD